MSAINQLNHHITDTQTARLITQCGISNVSQRQSMADLCWDNSDLWVVGRLLDDLRCHPEGRADECVSLDLGVRQLARHSKVCQLHFALLRQEHVGSWRRQAQSAGAIKHSAREHSRLDWSPSTDIIHSKWHWHYSPHTFKSQGLSSENIISMNYILNCLSLDYVNILFLLCNIMYLYPSWQS